MTPFLTIIIPCLNDSVQLVNTLRSLHRCTPHNAPIEIIVVDDGSDIPLSPVTLAKKTRFVTTTLRNPQRIGCAPSRRLAVNQASGEWLLFIDSHMVFHKGWFETFYRNFDQFPDSTVWCGTYVSLASGHDRIYESNQQDFVGGLPTPKPPAITFGGSDFFFTRYDGSTVAVMDYEGLPEVLEPPAVYQTACVVGANYFVNREWFKQIHALDCLQYWGGDEPSISIKSWLFGGTCRVMRDVRIAHIKQPPVTGRTSDAWLLYNKLALLHILLPKDFADALVGLLPHNPADQDAYGHLMRNWDAIKTEAAYVRANQTKSLQDYCGLWHIETPAATIAMSRYTLPIRPINDNPTLAQL